MTHRHPRHALRLLIALGSMACSSHSLAMPKALESATWTKMVAPPGATARAANVFVYDEARDNCVVFGGRPVDDRGFSFYDTGLWSRDTWVPVAAEYGRRGDVTGAFDRQRRRTVVYGGTDGFAFFADTWEFDGSGWTRHRVASPGARSGNGLAYDSQRNVTVLFGGYNGSSWKDELWEWDGKTWAQGCIAAPCSVAPRPAARANAVFVYDDTRGVSLLFGGSRDGQAYDDTWSWDGERWRELHPAHAPLARGSAAATYDPVSKRVLLFGGLAVGYHDLNDFWAWDGRDWSHISQTTVPFARHGAGMAWHAKERRGILFGGSASGRETDAWEFKLHGTPCTVTKDCHVGTCVQGSCAADPDLGSSTGGGSSSGGNSSGGNSSGGNSSGGNSSGGESGGQASGGCSCNAPTLDGGSGGDKPASPDGGAGGGAWGPSGASGGMAAGGGGTGVANPVAPLAEDDSQAIRSFYSCALSAPSRTTGAPPASTAILAGLVIWFSRRLSKTLLARVAGFTARDR